MMAQSKRGNGSRRGRHRGTWTEDHMKEAIKEVRKGAVSIAKVGEKFGIPETSIRDWMSGKTSSKKRGPRTVLTKEEEDAIVDWCLEMQRNGHSITFYMLRRKVADVCQGRETPFKNGVPGKSWMDWFRKRHPNVVIEAAHALKGKKRNDSEREILGMVTTLCSILHSVTWQENVVRNVVSREATRKSKDHARAPGVLSLDAAYITGAFALLFLVMELPTPLSTSIIYLLCSGNPMQLRSCNAIRETQWKFQPS